MRHARKLSFIDKTTIIFHRMLAQCATEPRQFTQALIYRVITGWGLYNILIWFYSGITLLSELAFNPEQFYRDFASLSLVQSQAQLTYDTLTASFGWQGGWAGFLFAVVVTWAKLEAELESGLCND
ncbi:hypothetical protein [Edwardsiella tarda]|uniref:Uncharacterized protein n=1 Tax=Edwardsiella tarda TaxID=636 RepID=A0A2A7U875_EDWTA|nr:hypothetical protein [Edwardsiella tarda]PEH74461.1 hypothetical protein CRM76_00250 [Edwardsiella tarda]